MALYTIYNGPSPTTAAQVAVTTGTAIKTMLQVLNAQRLVKVVEWGISFDGAAAAAGINCELLTTGTVAATVTAHVAAGVVRTNPASESKAAPDFTLTTTGTGYTGTAEGSITVSRMFDAQLIQPTAQYVKQWPLGREPVVDIADVLRVRVTAAAAVNAICYVVVEA